MSDWQYAQAQQHASALATLDAVKFAGPPEKCPNCDSEPLMTDEEGFCLKCNNTPDSEPDNPDDEHDPMRDHEKREADDETAQALYEAGL